MREWGVVRSVSGGGVEVSMAPAPEGCGDCRACGPSAEGRILVVSGPAGLRPGQRVEVDVVERGALGPAVVGFLVPVVALIVGAAVGSAVPGWSGLRSLSPAVGGALGGLALLLGALVPARIYDRRLRRRPPAARIVSVEP